jgi:hypothetical protein
MTEQKKAAPRGRPVTGTAKSASERSDARDTALKESGGRILSSVRLSRESAIALAALSKRYGSDREAIQRALIVAEKNDID